MRRAGFVIGAIAILIALITIYFVLSSDNALVTQPKGIIASQELRLIITNTILMLIILIPTAILILIAAWKYRATNAKAEYQSEQTYSFSKDAILWIIPSIIVAIMAVITWKETYALDPYKPLDSKDKPLVIQVVALNWKWLFIYPEQGIATVNFVQFPEKIPIEFALAADGSPMNSFWVPELSGQIYCMTGMITKLHIMAESIGEYRGKAAEINGDGYAKMTFLAKSTSQSDFDNWVKDVKKSSLQLTDHSYAELIRPSERNPIAFYSHVEKDFFNKIVMKYMHPHHSHDTSHTR